ncbi:hypothetical protein, partial [Stutzerimonas stutzeri]|uniref:hypothetical protein n=1 Tax=Stutzerimonas stutzeri TaxID=316 RepID=UPI00210CB834
TTFSSNLTLSRFFFTYPQLASRSRTFRWLYRPGFPASSAFIGLSRCNIPATFPLSNAERQETDREQT